MVKFPDNIHPKFKQRIRFLYSFRATQYLQFFNIIETYPESKFLPLNLKFETNADLQEFLYNKGILQDEYEVAATFVQVSEPITVVDASKIYDVEESINKYLENYKYYTINEVSEMLSFSRPTIYKIIKEGKIKTVRIYGQMRIKHSDLKNYINEKNTQ